MGLALEGGMLFLLACGWTETALFGGGDVVVRVATDTGTLEVVVPAAELPEEPGSWDSGMEPESCVDDAAQVRSWRRHRGFFQRLSGDWYDRLEVSVQGAKQVDAETCVAFDADVTTRPPLEPNYAYLSVTMRRGETTWDWRGVASQGDTAWDTGGFASSEIELEGAGMAGSVALDVSGHRWEGDWGTEHAGRATVSWSMSQERVHRNRWTAW